MSRKQTTFTLPVETGAQLRQLADALSITLTQLLAQMTKREIAWRRAHGLPLPDIETIEGFEIRRVGKHVELIVEGARSPFVITRNEAVGFAETLESIASKEPHSELAVLSNGGVIQVERQGNGLVIELDRLRKGSNKRRRTVTPEIAREIATQLRNAV